MRTLEVTRIPETLNNGKIETISIPPFYPVSIPNNSEATRDGNISNNKKPSYFHIPASATMLDKNIGELISYAASKFGDKPCFQAPFQDVQKSFVEVQKDVQLLSRGFMALGLKKGDRIATWSPNTYECYLTQLAGWNSGLIVVCINAALQSRELLYALNKAGVRAIVISKIFRTQNFYEILTKSIPEVKTTSPGQLKSPEAPELEFVISVESGLPGTIDFQKVLDIGANNIFVPENQDDVQFDDVSSLFFTSGTTGNPKAVMLSHHNFINNGFYAGRRLQLQSTDKICLPVPLFHVYGCQIGIFAALVYGAAVIIPSYGYDPKAIAKVVASERCTYICGTPTMFTDLVKILDGMPTMDLRSLKGVITGGALCTQQLVADLKEKLPTMRVISNYGMTEIGCTYMGLPEDSNSLASSTVGFPLENVEVKLVDKHGRIVPIGSEGELCVRSYAVNLGYWGEPEKTSEVMEPSRWFHTGDLFVMTESGHGCIVGRIKEMINRGGENVYPKEVEDFLKTHPKIREAQVFGVPDQRMGEEPAAWVDLKEGVLMTPEEVRVFCKGQIAHFKIPKYVFFRNDFPKTPLGKVQKFRMREETIKVMNKV